MAKVDTQKQKELFLSTEISDLIAYLSKWYSDDALFENIPLERLMLDKILARINTNTKFVLQTDTPSVTEGLWFVGAQWDQVIDVRYYDTKVNRWVSMRTDLSKPLVVPDESFTLGLTHLRRPIHLTGTNPIVTVDAEIDFVDETFEIWNLSTNNATLSPGGGVSIESAGSLTDILPKGRVVLRYLAEGTVIVSGDLL